MIGHIHVVVLCPNLQGGWCIYQISGAVSLQPEDKIIFNIAGQAVPA